MVIELTHILYNSYFCIDLVLTSQTESVQESRIHPSKYSNYYLTAYAKLV